MKFVEYYLSENGECLDDIPFRHEEENGCSPECPIPLALIASTFFLVRLNENDKDLMQIASPFAFFQTKKTAQMFFEYEGEMTMTLLTGSFDSEWRDKSGIIKTGPLLKAIHENGEKGFKKPLYFSSCTLQKKDELSYHVMLPSIPEQIKKEEEKLVFHCGSQKFSINLDSLKCNKSNVSIYVPGADGFFSPKVAELFSF